MTTIYHNPRCSKSRQTLQLLHDNNIQPEIRLYLQDALSIEEIQSLLKQLNMSPLTLMRTKENLYKALGLKNDTTDEVRLQAMHDNPSLIERPIVVHHNKAKIGRPPEAVLTLFK